MFLKNVLSKEQYTKNDILCDSFYVKFPDGKNPQTQKSITECHMLWVRINCLKGWCSFWDDESILTLYSGNDCTAVNILITLKWEILCYVSYISIKL